MISILSPPGELVIKDLQQAMKKWCWTDNTFHEREWLQSSVNETNTNPDVQAFLQNTPLALVKIPEECINFPQIIEANKNKHTYNLMLYLERKVLLK